MAVPQREDSWWFVAVATLVVVLALSVVIPVRLIGPIFGYSGRVADSPDTTLEVQPAQPPGPFLPVVALVLAGGLAILSTWKAYDERELNARWAWMLVAAGIVMLWAVLLLRMTVSFSTPLPAG